MSSTLAASSPPTARPGRRTVPSGWVQREGDGRSVGGAVGGRCRDETSRVAALRPLDQRCAAERDVHAAVGLRRRGGAGQLGEPQRQLVAGVHQGGRVAAAAARRRDASGWCRPAAGRPC